MTTSVNVQANLVNIIEANNGLISSVELAKVCVGESKDAHPNFMKKAEKVLGKDIVNFYDISKDAYGRDRKVLLLPEREACLMAMSYSYELQAAVFDAYTAYRQALLNIAAATTIEEVQEVVLSLKDKRMNHIVELNKQGKFIGKSVSLVLQESIDTPKQMIEDLKTISESMTVVSGGRERFWENAYTIVEKLRKVYRMEAKDFNPIVYSEYEQVLHYCTKRMKHAVKLAITLEQKVPSTKPEEVKTVPVEFIDTKNMVIDWGNLVKSNHTIDNLPQAAF